MSYLLSLKIRWWYLLTAVCIFFSTSCRKDKDVVGQEGTESFIINVVGVEKPEEVTNKAASTAAKDNFTLTSKVTEHGGGFYTEAAPLELSKMESILDKPTVSSQKRADSQPMEINKTFAIIIYNLSNDQIISKQVAKVGAATVITVNKNVEYGYIAFSYNNTDMTLLDDFFDNELSDLVITSPTDKDFLYVKGRATAAGLNTPINLVFQHMVSQVDLRINTSAMAGYKLDPTSSLDFQASFNPDYTPLWQGEFSLLEGTYTNQSTYNPTNINFTAIAGDTLYSSTFYTVAPVNNFTIFLTRLNVSLSGFDTGSGPTKVSLIPDGDTKNVNFQFSGFVHFALGKKITATMYPYVVLPELRILHVSGPDDSNGFSASPTAMTTTSAHVYDPNAGASYNMLKAEVNFGAKRSSKFKIKGFSHIRATSAGDVATILNSASTRPDIIIFGPGYSWTADDEEAMVKYTSNMNNGVNANEFGGIPMLWLVSASDYTQYYGLYSYVFGPVFSYENLGYSAIATAGSVCGSGWSDGRITNGVFSGASYGYWGAGEHLIRPDANWQQMPSNVYDYVRGFYASVIPQNGPSYPDDGYHMWEGRTYSITYVGDGGFLGNPDAWGSRTESTYYPFATDNQYRPITRGYGYAKTSGSQLPANFLQVSNSLMFGNYMAYASIKARYFGVNKLVHDAAASQP